MYKHASRFLQNMREAGALEFRRERKRRRKSKQSEQRRPLLPCTKCHHPLPWPRSKALRAKWPGLCAICAKHMNAKPQRLCNPPKTAGRAVVSP